MQDPDWVLERALFLAYRRAPSCCVLTWQSSLSLPRPLRPQSHQIKTLPLGPHLTLSPKDLSLR